MTIRFTKMHGLGNDFMVIDGVNQSATLTADQIRRWSCRHTGVGFDQLLLIEPPVSQQADFTYRIFNADGGEVGQCGNGARCVGQFLIDEKLTTKDSIRLQTKTHLLQVELQDEAIRVEMGVPYVKALDGELAPHHFVDVGNPHLVILVDDLTQCDVQQEGKALTQHPSFTEGVNVGFAEILSPQQVQLCVYERGVGLTQACGSGACAAVAVGRQLGLLDIDVRVDQSGGPLFIHWLDEKQPLWMQGAAVTVFEGEILLAS